MYKKTKALVALKPRYPLQIKKVFIPKLHFDHSACKTANKINDTVVRSEKFP